MLKKLLKYDMKAIWRLWWIIVVTIPVLALVGGLTLGMLIRSAEISVAESMGTPFSTVFYAFGVFGVLTCLIGMSGISILTPVLVYWRFYKNLFSDEGYLTFTLPVSRRAHLFSKTLNAFIWTSLTSVLLFAGFIVFICIGLSFVPDVNIAEQILKSLKAVGEVIWNGLGGWSIVYAIEAILMIVVSSLYSICLIQCCITVGSVIAKKYKLLAAVGIYYGANLAISLISRIISSVYSIIMGEGLANTLLFNATIDEGLPIWCAVFLIAIIGMAAITALIYAFTQWLIDRKLNLA